MADVSITVDAQTGKALQGILKLVDGMNKMEAGADKAGKKLGFMEEQGKKLEGALAKTFRIDLVNAFQVGLGAVQSLLSASVGRAEDLNRQILRVAGTSVGISNLPALKKGLEGLDTKFGSPEQRLAAANAAAEVLRGQTTVGRQLEAAEFGTKGIGAGFDPEQAAKVFSTLRLADLNAPTGKIQDLATFVLQNAGFETEKFATRGRKSLLQLTGPGGLSLEEATALQVAGLQSGQGGEALQLLTDKALNLPEAKAGKRGQAGGDEFASLRGLSAPERFKAILASPQLQAGLVGDQAAELQTILGQLPSLQGAAGRRGSFAAELAAGEANAGDFLAREAGRAALGRASTSFGQATLDEVSGVVRGVEDVGRITQQGTVGDRLKAAANFLGQLVGLAEKTSENTNPANKLGPDGGG